MFAVNELVNWSIVQKIVCFHMLKLIIGVEIFNLKIAEILIDIVNQIKNDKKYFEFAKLIFEKIS